MRELATASLARVCDGTWIGAPMRDVRGARAVRARVSRGDKNIAARASSWHAEASEIDGRTGCYKRSCINKC